MEEQLIVALEIGSSKIKGAIGAVDATGALTVKAVEEEKITDSVRYGLIRNVAEVSEAITSVINRLEAREPGRKVTGVYISVGGRSLMSKSVDVERRLPTEMEITSALIEDLTKDALLYQLDDRKVIDVTPREFRVDNAPTTRPVGTYGRLVQGKLNVVSLRNQIWRNLNHVLIDRLNLKINDFFVRQIVEADLVLLTEEKRLGCVFVDFGAETTTVSIYKHGVLQYLATIPLGSRNITRDITTLNHLEEQAEELKITGGNAQPQSEQPAPGTSFSSGAKDYTEVNNYVSARAGEIIANIAERIKASGFSAGLLPAGIIIVGRGAKLTNFNQRLHADTGMKVRAGVPAGKVRINDSRITPSDAVDVISVLTAASIYPEECMPPVKQESMFVADTQPVIMPETKVEEVKTVVTPAARESARPAAATARPVPAGEPVQQPLKPAAQDTAPQATQSDTPRPATNPYTTSHTTSVPVNPPTFEKVTDETVQEPAVEEEVERPGYLKRFWSRLANRVADIMSEPDYENEDDSEE